MTQAPTPGPLSGDDDLLPCPFCEGDVIVTDSQECQDAETYYWHRCAGCGVESEGAHGASAARDQWNMRPQPFRLAPTAPVEVPDGMMTIADELEDKADELDQMDARGQIWGLEDVSDIMRRAATALRPAPVASGGQHSSGEGETLRVLLDNLVIAQTLSKDIRQKATDEARSYLYDLRHTPARAEAPSGDLRTACQAVLDDYQTSDTHHPDHILIRRTDFDRIKALVEAPVVARAEAQDEGAAGERDKRAWIDRWNAIEGAAQDALHTMSELLEAPNLKRMQYALGERRDALASALNLPEAGTAWMRPAHPSPTPAADADRVRK